MGACGDARTLTVLAQEAEAAGWDGIFVWFTPTDRVDLILFPLMRQSRPVHDVLREAAPLTQRLPEGQQEPTVGALLGLAYHDGQEAVVHVQAAHAYGL
jgi:hypothetical protein